MIPISVKMYFRWHFEKEIREKVRGTRLIFSPFSVAALLTFREYMMVENPALYITPPNRLQEYEGETRLSGACWWRTQSTFLLP